MKAPVALPLVALLACTPTPEGGADAGPDAYLPPEKVPVSGTLSVAAGLSAADYDFWDNASPAKKAVGADGAFSGEAKGRKAGILFATPRDGTPTGAKLAAAGAGLYMTPSPGVKHLVATTKDGKTSYALSDTGGAAMNATTTVLALLLAHPMLSNPWHAMQQAQLQWLIEKANAGWPALAAAAQAWDAGLAAGRDPSGDEAFKTAVQQCVDDVGEQMPEPAPTEPAWGSLGRGLEDVPYATATAGRKDTKLEEKARSPEKVELEPSNEVGTGLDFLYIAHELDPTQFPDGIASEKFASPKLTPDPVYPWKGAYAGLGTGFVGARSYASYLDVMGNATSWISKKLFEQVGAAPKTTVDLTPRKIYQFLFFSGSFQGETDAAVYNYANLHYHDEVRAALFHNMTTVVVETIQVMPLGEMLVGEEAAAGTDALQAIIVQVITEVEALMRLKAPSAVTREDLYAIIFNTAKAAIDSLATSAANQGAEWGLEKLMEYAKKGAKGAFKTVLGMPGRIAKGGSAANRAMRLVRPRSIMEMHLVAVGYRPPQTFNLSLSEKIDGKCLGEHGNQVLARVEANVVSEKPNWAVTNVEQTYNDMGDFIQAHLKVTTNGGGGGVTEGFEIGFTEPAKFSTSGDLGAGRRYEWEWQGYTGVNAGYQDKSGAWVHDTQSGGRYSAWDVSLFGATFTGTAKTRWRFFTRNDDGTETMQESTRMYNYSVTFQ